MKKKYIILLTIITMLFTGNLSVKAYTVDADTDSESHKVQFGGCGEGITPEGCSSASQDFKVRISLMKKDKNTGELKIVPGTRIIDFVPKGDYETEYKKSYDGNEEIKEYVNFKEVYGNETKNATKRFYGSIVARKNTTNTNINLCSDTADIEGKPVGTDSNGNPTGNCQSKKIYYTYMGFDPNKGNDFESYKKNHDDFIRYITSEMPQNEYHNKNIKFIDQFLFLSGFTDEISASSDYDTLKELYQNGYYLAIEPIYSISIAEKGGPWHTVEGTIKQIAAFSLNDKRDRNKMWIQYLPEIRYNHTCNFIENTSVLEEGIAYASKYEGETQRNVCNAYSNFEKEMTDAEKEEYVKNLMHPTSPFGVNMVSVIQATGTDEENIMCLFEYDACTNNDYEFSLNLYNCPDGDCNNKKSSAQDLAKCVYTDLFSEDSKVAANEMKKYFYNDFDSNGNQIWCYDNVTYDFSGLKKLQNKNFKSFELIDLPAGKLTIDRTCYGNADVTEQLVRDAFPDTIKNIENDNNISLTLNSQIYYFKLTEENRNNHKPSLIEQEENQFDELFGVDQAKLNEKIYKKTYEYYYQIDNTHLKNIVNKLYGDYYINVVDNIVSTHGNFQHDKLIKSDYDTSSMIKTSTQNKYIEKYDNSLIFTPKNGINNSDKRFGISSDTYSKIVLDGQKKIDKKNFIVKTGMIIDHTVHITLTANTDSQNECSFQTTVKDIDILGEGLKFRTISLSNPFPGRDGTSRLPGVNWLSDYNYVYDYIINNRNVKGEEVYKKEPLYKITLTPQTMLEIRKINKEKAYDDFGYKCEGKTGQKCVSTFLTNLMNENKLEGTCVYKRSDDIHAVDTKFYSCADKTLKSAGKCYYTYDSTIDDYINSCTGKKLKDK